MHCTDIHTHIDDYLEQALSEADGQRFDAHMHTCEACQNSVQQAKSLQYALQNMPIEPTDNDFEQRILSKVHGQAQPQPNKRFLTEFTTTRFVAAMVASLAIWFAVSLFQPGLTEPEAATLNLTLNTSHTVNLKFDAPHALQQVSMSIELPPHIALADYPGRKKLSWTTQFNKGANVLSLPIKAIAQGNGELIAQIKYGNKTKYFKITLNTHLNGAWQLKPLHSSPIT